MKGYIKTTVFAIVVIAVLWYFIGSKSALDFVKEPELVFGLSILIIIILLNGKIRSNLRKIRYDKLSEEEKAVVTSTQTDWYKGLMQKLTRTKPLEEEHDILMNHEYDGIRELDNDLPPWWVYGFYATIIFAIAYLSYYHIYDGDTQETLFNKEMTQAKLEIEEYKKTATGLIDASNVSLLTDEADLASGKNIYNTSCMACHLADGGGSIGPNLTDEYWILGGGIKNVFATVSNGGREGKGMIPWKATLGPKEIAQVSSYILSLQGTTPQTAKAAEGDLWEGE